jgi:hypothetical protein
MVGETFDKSCRLTLKQTKEKMQMQTLATRDTAAVVVSCEMVSTS